MRKLWTFVKREQILPVVGVVFLLVALVTSGTALLAPMYLTAEGAARYYAINNGTQDLHFILTYSVATPLLAGAALAAWKLLWPTPVQA
jgi:hypothetical protein